MKNERQTAANLNPQQAEAGFPPILLNDEQRARLAIAYSAFSKATRDLDFPIGETGLYSAARLHSLNGVSLLNELTKIGCIHVDSIVTFPSGMNLRMIHRTDALLFFVARDYAIESEKKPTHPEYCELLEPYRNINHVDLIQLAEHELSLVIEMEAKRKEEREVTQNSSDPIFILIRKIINERNREFVMARNSKAISPIKSAIWPVSISDFSKITGVDFGIIKSYLSGENPIIDKSAQDALKSIVNDNKIDFATSRLTQIQTAALMITRYRDQLPGNISLIEALNLIKESDDKLYKNLFESLKE